MKLLMLSTDENLFCDARAVRSRIAGFGTVAESVHVVVAVRERKSGTNDGITSNVVLHGAIGQGKIGRFIAMYRTASQLLSSGGRWVISSQDPFELGLLGLLLKIRFGMPLELQVHTDFLSPYFQRESLLHRIRTFVGIHIIPHGDLVRVVSERIRTSLLARTKLPAEKVYVRPVFIDPRLFANETHSGKTNERFIILAVGRLAKEKNFTLAINAIAKISRDYPRVLLRIVGEGPELKNLQITTYNLQLQQNVEFKPWTDNIAEEYRSADVVCITSNYEGYGRTAVEAMLAGIPVVMTDVGVAGDLVRDRETGRVVPVGDVGALADVLGTLIADKKGREKIGRGARNVASRLPRQEAYFEEARSMLSRLRPKLCYVLPNYQEDDATHFVYLTRFIREILNEYDVRLIVERGNLPKQLPLVAVHGAEHRIKGIWVLRLMLCIVRARLAGYRTFYVHYSFLAAFFAKLIGGKIYYWNCGEPWKYERNFFRERFERSTYHMVDMLVTGTEGLREAYARHYSISPLRISVMPNWIDVHALWGKTVGDSELRSRLGIHTSKKIILFVHRLSQRKGAHYLLDIVQKMKQQAVLVVVGDGPEHENLKSQISNLKLDERVKMVGAVPNRHLGPYYAIADVFLMPSEEEGFPHVLLEAMAYGVPFVASDVGGVKDIVPPSMYNSVIPPWDTDRFAERLDAMVSLPREERQTLSTVLEEWVLRYNLGVAVQAFNRIIG